MMNYKKIIFHQIPIIGHAHNYTTDSYNHSFQTVEDFLDITYVDAGDILISSYDISEHLIPAQSIFYTARKSILNMRCDAPLHRHATIGIRVKFDILPITEAQIIDCCRNIPEDNEVFAIFPDYLMINQNNSVIEKKLQSIIRSHSVSTHGRDLLCTGLLFELLSEITNESIRSVLIKKEESIPPSSGLYVNRAINYISDHLNSKMSINEIASHLGISEGYLAIIFKTSTGQKIVEYITRAKINLVKELIINKNISLREAGEAVGITDTNYLSRLFKKYTGINAREYKLLQYKKEIKK